MRQQISVRVDGGMSNTAKSPQMGSKDPNFLHPSLFLCLLFSQKVLSYGFVILHGLTTHKNIRIPPLLLAHKLSYSSESFYKTSEGLGYLDMFSL